MPIIDKLNEQPWFQRWSKKVPWFLQFLRFGLVGVSNTLIGLGVYYLLAGVFSVNVQAANAISFIVSVINAYIWNTRWVFQPADRQNRKTIKVPLKFFISYGITYLLSAGLLWLWIDVLHISKYVAPILSLIVTVPVNFLLNKFWTFRKAKVFLAQIH